MAIGHHPPAIQLSFIDDHRLVGSIREQIFLLPFERPFDDLDEDEHRLLPERHDLVGPSRIQVALRLGVERENHALDGLITRDIAPRRIAARLPLSLDDDAIGRAVDDGKGAASTSAQSRRIRRR